MAEPYLMDIEHGAMFGFQTQDAFIPTLHLGVSLDGDTVSPEVVY